MVVCLFLFVCPFNVPWGAAQDVAPAKRADVELIHKIVFYNCENLFDPSNDSTKLDDEFTPEGERRWTYFRQYSKILNIGKALVLAGSGLPPSLIGLAEVENDSVLLRLVRQSPLRQWEYEYVITHGPDLRGINVALLYQPLDYRLLGSEAIVVSVPDGHRPTRHLLHTWGRVVGGDTLDVVVCHLPSRMGGVKASAPIRASAHRTIRHLCDSLQQARLHPYVVVMGDMNDYPTTRSLCRNMHFGEGLHNLMIPLQRQLERGELRYGSHKHDGEWGILDQFWVNDSLLREQSDSLSSKDVCTQLWVDNIEIVVAPFMLTNDRTHFGQRPLRSYYGFHYEGGFSDHLPISMDLHIRY